MKKIKIVIFLFLINYCLYGQGFDWQYSARMPSGYPRLFVSLGSGAIYNFHFGDFGFMENSLFCSKFKKGKGISYFVSGGIEYWYEGNLALNMGLSYLNLGGNFSVFESQPRIIDTLLSEYSLKTSISYIQTCFSFKRRIDEALFFWGGGLNIGFFIKNGFEIKEKILKPDDFPWRERKIDGGQINELHRVLFIPTLFIGYDFNMGLGMYGSVILFSDVSVNTIAQNSNWRVISVGLRIQFNKDLGIIYVR